MNETDSGLVGSANEFMWAALLVVAVVLLVALVVWLARRSG
jgi:flagellar biosynthesis protein FliQ